MTLPESPPNMLSGYALWPTLSPRNSEAVRLCCRRARERSRMKRIIWLCSAG